MADTFARVGDAVVGYAVTGTSDMPDFSGDHFTWEGHCWEAVTDPGLLVATMDPAASPAAKEALAARIVQAMSVATKKLVVTEEAILNHATLIGQTVVDDINVQGKLVGTDGVFTGTVDFENVNVTDELLASRISGEHIYGTVIEGGLFKTSDALPGQVEFADDAYVTHLDGGGAYPGLRIVPIDTSETNLPAAIGPSADGLTIFGGRSISGGSSIVQCNPGESLMRTFRDNGTVGGVIQTAPTFSLMRTYQEDGTVGGVIQTAPALSLMRTYQEDGTVGGEIQAAPTVSLMRTYQEDGTKGGEIHTSPTSSVMRTYRADGTEGGVIQTSPTSSVMRTYSGNGSESGWVQVRPQDAEIAYVSANNNYFSHVKADADEAFLYTQAGGASRFLSVDANGIWAKTNASGSWQHVNLVPEVRQFQYSSQWNADQSPAHIMVQHLPGGKLCQAQIRIQNLTGSKLSLPHDDWVLLNYNPIPADLRGGFTDYIEVTLPQLNARGRVEMNYSTGRIRVKSLEKDKDGKGVTIDWHNNNSIWFPMRWFSPN